MCFVSGPAPRLPPAPHSLPITIPDLDSAPNGQCLLRQSPCRACSCIRQHVTLCLNKEHIAWLQDWVCLSWALTRMEPVLRVGIWPSLGRRIVDEFGRREGRHVHSASLAESRGRPQP